METKRTCQFPLLKTLDNDNNLHSVFIDYMGLSWSGSTAIDLQSYRIVIASHRIAYGNCIPHAHISIV